MTVPPRLWLALHPLHPPLSFSITVFCGGRPVSLSLSLLFYFIKGREASPPAKEEERGSEPPPHTHTHNRAPMSCSPHSVTRFAPRPAPQVVMPPHLAQGLTSGACVRIAGELVPSRRDPDRLELQADSLDILGATQTQWRSFPLQAVKARKGATCSSMAHAFHRNRSP